MIKPITAFLTFLLAAPLAFAADKSASHQEADRFCLQSEPGLPLLVETVEGGDAYLCIGFATPPLVYDLTDETRPVLLTGYLELESEGEHAAYLRYPSAALLQLSDEQAITEIESISLD